MKTKTPTFFKRHIILTAVITLQIILILIVNRLPYNLVSPIGPKNSLPIIESILIVLTALLILRISISKETTRKKAETDILQLQVNMAENTVKKLQSQRHEFIRHLQTIQAMIYLDEIESAKQYLNDIAKNKQHIENLVKNWIDTGDPVLTIQLNNKRSEAQAKGIEFVFTVTGISPTSVKTNDLCSIVGNLIENAFEATMEYNGPKKVEVKISGEDDGFKICVTNTGPPIPDKLRKKILEPGFTTKADKSRGYGLYVVTKIVNKYNGAIHLASGNQTTFTVFLPETQFDLTVNQ